MDKVAANNHFVSMRKEVKKAKAMVAQKLIRKISKLKQEREKATDDSDKQRIESKIAKVLSDTKLLKQLDPYNISKQATLKPGADVWTRVLDASQSTGEERLIARVICKNNIQKRVKTFREENQDLDEWINEYIEYREKKREIKEETGVVSKLRRKSISNKSDSVFNGHSKTDKRKSNLEMRSRGNSRTRGRSNIGSKEGADAKIKEKEAGYDEPLHPSWDAKRKEKDLVRMALEGKFKSQKLDLTGES